MLVWSCSDDGAAGSGLGGESSPNSTVAPEAGITMSSSPSTDHDAAALPAPPVQAAGSTAGLDAGVQAPAPRPTGDAASSTSGDAASPSTPPNVAPTPPATPPPPSPPAPVPDPPLPELGSGTIPADTTPDAQMPPRAPEMDAGPPLGGDLDGAFGIDATALLAAAPADAGTSADAGADSADEQLRARVLAKLRACQIVGPGEFFVRPIRDTLDRCVAGCTLDASCSSISTLLCASMQSSPLAGCQANCTRPSYPDGFECDGDRAVPYAAVCDAYKDCRDGTDQSSCGSFLCTNGTLLPSAYTRCDGKRSCADGSDEEGCAWFCTPQN
ncbi:MAG: hypothetical protein JWN48_1040 [Myxococcaceae bacterium]|nr:hypothetical protein [Myxococcaceae bacterium]